MIKTFFLVIAMICFALTGCQMFDSDDDDDSGSSETTVISTTTESNGTTESSSENNGNTSSSESAETSESSETTTATGKISADGKLTLNNIGGGTILVFADSISDDTFVGEIQGRSSITVKLDEEKYYTLITVVKSAYEENPALANQTHFLAYYSSSKDCTLDIHASVYDKKYVANTISYTITNNTDYWVFCNPHNNTIYLDGETIELKENTFIAAPNSVLSIPIVRAVYDYHEDGTVSEYEYNNSLEIVYKKELTYAGETIGMTRILNSKYIELDTTDTNISIPNDDSYYSNITVVRNNLTKDVQLYDSNGEKIYDERLNSEGGMLKAGESAFFFNSSFPAVARTAASDGANYISLHTSGSGYVSVITIYNEIKATPTSDTGHYSSGYTVDTYPTAKIEKYSVDTYFD